MNQTKISALAIALLLSCLIAPISFYAGRIPITLQTLILFIIPLFFGKKIGFLNGLIYIAIGAIGVPVFGNYTSGFEKLIGPTAGFIWAFPFISYYIGWEAKRKEANFFNHISILFKAHIFLFIPGFIVLNLSYDGLKLWDTIVRLLPGLLAKTIVGGIISAYILNHLPPSASEFIQRLKSQK